MQSAVLLAGCLCIAGALSAVVSQQTAGGDPQSGQPEKKNPYTVDTSKNEDWYHATLSCESAGGTLAVIRSREDNDQVLEAIRQSGVRNGRFWTAGKTFMGSGWLWRTNNFTGREPITFSDWYWTPLAHHYVGADCLELKEYETGYQWNSGTCHNTNYKICQFNDRATDVKN